MICWLVGRDPSFLLLTLEKYSKNSIFFVFYKPKSWILPNMKLTIPRWCLLSFPPPLLPLTFLPSPQLFLPFLFYISKFFSPSLDHLQTNTSSSPIFISQFVSLIPLAISFQFVMDSTLVNTSLHLNINPFFKNVQESIPVSFARLWCSDILLFLVFLDEFSFMLKLCFFSCICFWIRRKNRNKENLLMGLKRN